MTSHRLSLALGLTCSLLLGSGCSEPDASEKKASTAKPKRARRTSNGSSKTRKSRSTVGKKGAAPAATPSAKKIFESIVVDATVAEIVRDQETARSFGEGAPINESDSDLVHEAARKMKAAQSELGAHIVRHRRRPPSVSPEQSTYLAQLAVMHAASARGTKRVPRERALARALAFAFSVAGVLIVEEKAHDPESEAGRVEDIAYAVAWPFFEAGKIPRTEHTRLINALSQLDEVDIGKTKAIERNVRRAKRRVLALGLRRTDKRMVPRLPDPFSTPNPLRTATDPGRVYSVGENRKDDIGHPAADIVLMLPEGATR